MIGLKQIKLQYTFKTSYMTTARFLATDLTKAKFMNLKMDDK